MQKLLRLRQVMAVTSLSRSLIYDMAASGKFPQAVKVGERAVAWVEQEVSDWLDQRILDNRATFHRRSNSGSADNAAS